MQVFYCSYSVPLSPGHRTSRLSESAFLADAYEEKTNARGADFYYESYVGDAPDGFEFCYSGQVCNGTALTGATSLSLFTNQIPITSSGGCLGDVCTPGGSGHGIS